MKAGRLEDALKYVARCAAVDPAYLPIFERLETELEKVRSQENARDRAFRLAQEAA